MARNVTYRVECTLCDHLYIGESHRTLYDRLCEHMEDITNMDENNPMVKHILKHHPAEKPGFKWTLHRPWKTSLARQLGEAILIAIISQDRLMNSKSEWGNNRIPRVVLDQPDPSLNSSNSQASTSRPAPAEAPPQTPERSPERQAKRKRGCAPPPTILSQRGIKVFLATNKSIQRSRNEVQDGSDRVLADGNRLSNAERQHTAIIDDQQSTRGQGLIGEGQKGKNN